MHDVFVLQIAGEKHWRIHEPVLTDPLRTQPWTDRAAEVAAAAEREPVIDAVLRPGDALYLPRGYLHSATALGEISAHLTIGVHPVTRWAAAESALDLVRTLAAEDPQLRGSLPLGLDLADPDAVAGRRGRRDRRPAGLARPARPGRRRRPAARVGPGPRCGPSRSRRWPSRPPPRR